MNVEAGELFLIATSVNGRRARVSYQRSALERPLKTALPQAYPQ